MILFSLDVIADSANVRQHLEYGWLRLGRSIWISGGVLALYSDHMLLTSERLFRVRHYTLPRVSITRISEKRWLLFSGELRIEHTVGSYPCPIVFYSKDIEVLQIKLQQLAFPLFTSDI